MESFICPTLYVRNHLPVTSKLSSSARVLLDIFIAYMGIEDNLVIFCDGGMEFYLHYCKEKLQITYSEKTIRNAISELSKEDLLLRCRKDIYFINPVFFCKFHFKFDHKRLIENVQKSTGKTLLDKNIKEVHIEKKEYENTLENSND
jgi:hypothetical protein